MTVHNLDALLKPRTVVLLGEAKTAGQLQLLHNVSNSLPADRRPQISATSLSQLYSADLAIGFDGRLLRPEVLTRLAAVGCRALIWATDVPVDAARLHAARATGLRLLGARTPGVANISAGLNFSAFQIDTRPGRLALIAQSRTVAAAALDWAAGRDLGFSWLAVTGAEADVDVADLLDYAALDPQTEAVVVQLGHIGNARKFMSAARALARAKPVAILQTRAADSPGFGADPVRSAAFQRAGLVECETLGSLFDAIAALERLPRQHEPRIAVVGNGAGVIALGVDALYRQGLPLADIPGETWNAIKQRWPLARRLSGALDLGSVAAAEVVAAIALLLESGAANTVVLVHSPGPGEAHNDLVDALIAAKIGPRVLTVWLGLATAAAARARCAKAGIPTFAAAGDAARALLYRRLHRQTQELLSRTPPAVETRVADAAAIADAIAKTVAAGAATLAGPVPLDWLVAYGVGRPGSTDRPGPAVRVRVQRHAELGLCLSVRADIPILRVATAYGFLPLDALLTQRLLEAAGFIWAEPGHDELEKLATALIRLGQFVIEQPRIVTIEARIQAPLSSARCIVSDLRIGLETTAAPERERLALAPYPAELEHEAVLKNDQRVNVRAIRPEDEPQIIRMLEQTDPEAIRLRFFISLRYFSHAMAARLSQIDYDRELVLVALPSNDPQNRVVAMAHLSAEPDGQRAEYAVLVHQDYARLGLGQHLLRQLLALAAKRGVGKVYGEVLADNAAMLGLCRQLGFEISREPHEPGCLHVEIKPEEVGERRPNLRSSEDAPENLSPPR